MARPADHSVRRAGARGVLTAYVFRDSLNLDAARRFVRYLNVSGGGTDGQFLFDAGNANQYADFDGGLAVAGATGISTYEADGSEFTVVQEKLTTPESRSWPTTSAAMRCT